MEGIWILDLVVLLIIPVVDILIICLTFNLHSHLSTFLQVLFSDIFLKSFKKLRSERTKKSVIGLLLKLSSGWRPKRMKVDLLCGNSSQMLKKFKVEGLYVVCSRDIEKEKTYTQVLKIWDILPLEDIPKLVKRLDSIFGSYTDDFISRCNEKCFEG